MSVKLHEDNWRDGWEREGETKNVRKDSFSGVREK